MFPYPFCDFSLYCSGEIVNFQLPSVKKGSTHLTPGQVPRETPPEEQG